MSREQFKIGDRVVDKRDKAKTVGVLLELRRHTNGSAKWIVQYPEGRFSNWEVDLLPAPKAEPANR